MDLEGHGMKSAASLFVIGFAALLLLLLVALLTFGRYTVNKNIRYDRLTGAVWICYTDGCKRIPEKP
jgi:hypothetical protein